MTENKLKRKKIYIYKKGEYTYEITRNNIKTEIWIYQKNQFLKEKFYEEYEKSSDKRIIEIIEKSHEKWIYEYDMDMYSFGVE